MRLSLITKQTGGGERTSRRNKGVSWNTDTSELRARANGIKALEAEFIHTIYWWPNQLSWILILSYCLDILAILIWRIYAAQKWSGIFYLNKPHLKGGVLTMPKNRNSLGLGINRKPRVVGAEHCALRPRAGVSCNLIYRTLKGSFYG